MKKMEKPAPSKQIRLPPTPTELVSHYEAQGMDKEAASLKVIGDLQGALFRLLDANKDRKAMKQQLQQQQQNQASDPAARSRVEAVAAARLAVIDAKLDSKPGFGQTFAIGVASGVAVNGIGTLLPHIVAAVSSIWTSARSVTRD